jgi:hypothetical protein
VTEQPGKHVREPTVEEQALKVLHEHRVKHGIRNMKLNCWCGWTTEMGKGAGTRHWTHIVQEMIRAGLLMPNPPEPLSVEDRDLLVDALYVSKFGQMGYFGRVECEQFADAMMPAVRQIVMRARTGLGPDDGVDRDELIEIARRAALLAPVRNRNEGAAALHILTQTGVLDAAVDAILDELGLTVGE